MEEYIDYQKISDDLYRSLVGPIHTTYQDLRELVRQRGDVDHDLEALRRAHTDVGEACRRILELRREALIIRIRQKKEGLSLLARSCLRWTGSSFVSMDPWEPLTNGGYRRERYQDLSRKKFKSAYESWELRLLKLCYEEDA